MYEFYIEYTSYMCVRETMTVTADTESDARRLFNALRPLSDIDTISKVG